MYARYDTVPSQKCIKKLMVVFHEYKCMLSVVIICFSFLFQNKSLPIENTTNFLGMLANLCRTMLEDPWSTDHFITS